VSFDDTQDPDRRAQKIDRATCLANATILRRALAAHRFRGVAIRRSHCSTHRQVVVVSPATWTQMEASHLTGLARRRPATALELSVDDAVTSALRDPDASIDLDPDADIASLTGALIIVLFGVNGDETGPAHAAVIAQTPGGPRVLVDDLR
jgi:hypothetical protein